MFVFCEAHIVQSFQIPYTHKYRMYKYNMMNMLWGDG